MRRYLLFVFLLATQIITKAAVITWVGASGGNWNTASNWSPANVPTLSDDVVFNTSVNVAIDISPVSINSLHFINNCTVTFQTNATRNFRLYSTSTILPALLIEAGSNFTLNGTNAGTNNSTIDLTNAPGVIGSIYGTLSFSCTGGAGFGPKLNTDYVSATNYGIVTVYNGGLIKILPGADNTQSSSTPVSTFVMQSGATYENFKNGGSFPDGTWDVNSLARALSPGSNGPSFNGSVYGNLEWNCPAQTAVAFLNKNITLNNVDFISTGSNNTPNAGSFRIKTGASSGTWTMTINGNFTIGTNSEISITSSNTPSGSGGILVVKGDIINQGSITTYGTAGTVNELSLLGVANQNIGSPGTISGSLLNITINNPAGATLNTPLILPYSLALTSGKVTTTSPNLLTMIDNATYTGGSATSFIDGPMKKIGDDNFIFPVGKGSIYAPIGISGSGGAITDEFTAEYLRINPQSIHGPCPAACAGGLDHVSYVEYWKLNQDVGTSAKQVSLEVHALSFCKMLANTFVSRWNGAQWTNETTAILAGPNACGASLQCGTIQASNTTTVFGDFTLSTDQPFLNNPLPVTLVDFKVKKYSDQAAVVEWELTDYCFTATQFELEHSTDKTSFAVISVQHGKENSRFYFYNDTRIAIGTNWYRLKITEVDGKVTYSKVIAIINDTKGLLISSVFPNPASNTAIITLSAARSGMADIQLYDISGTVVYRRRSAIAEGTNNLPIQLGKLSAGVYHLAVQSADSKAVYRLVKQ